MSRYATTKQIKGSDRKRKAETTIISATPPTDLDTYIEITSPERLDQLANQFYGDASKWWIIATANALGKGTLFTPEDIILRIPPAADIQKFIDSENKQR